MEVLTTLLVILTIIQPFICLHPVIIWSQDSEQNSKFLLLIISIWFLPLVIHIVMKALLNQSAQLCSRRQKEEENEKRVPAFRKRLSSSRAAATQAQNYDDVSWIQIDVQKAWRGYWIFFLVFSEKPQDQVQIETSRLDHPKFAIDTFVVYFFDHYLLHCQQWIWRIQSTEFHFTCCHLGVCLDDVHFLLVVVLCHGRVPKNIPIGLQRSRFGKCQESTAAIIAKATSRHGSKVNHQILSETASIQWECIFCCTATLLRNFLKVSVLALNQRSFSFDSTGPSKLGLYKDRQCLKPRRKYVIKTPRIKHCQPMPTWIYPPPLVPLIPILTLLFLHLKKPLKWSSLTTTKT